MLTKYTSNWIKSPLRRLFDYGQHSLSLNVQRAVLIVFILCQVLFFTGYSAFQRMRIENDAARILRNTALLKAQQFETGMAAMRYQMHVIGDAILLNHGITAENPKTFIDQELKQDWLDMVIVFNAEGNVVATNSQFQLEHVLFGYPNGRPTFQQSQPFVKLQYNRVPEDFFYLYSYGLNEYIIGIVVDVYDIHGQLKGGVVGYLKSSTMGHLTHEMEGLGLDLGPGGIMSLMDRSTGVTLARTAAGARNHIYHDGYEGASLMKYASDTAILNQYISPVDGIARLGVFININDCKWVLAVELSKSDILHDWYIQTIVSSLAILIMAILQWQLLHYARINFLQRKQLLKESRQDPLTSLSNRRHFDEWGSKLCSQANRYNEPLSILCFDLDYFKKINDLFGHDGGDAVLKHIAHILETILRESDLAARFGGEEFVVILPHTDLSGAFQVAERIRIKISNQKIIFRNQEICFTASFGVAQVTSVEMTQSQAIYAALSRADSALYRSKQAGRNRTTVAE